MSPALYPRLIAFAFSICLLSGCTSNKSGGTARSSTGTAQPTSTTTETSTSTSTSAGTSARSLVVSWAASRESGVNSSAGGYRVYYSRQSGFSTATAGFVTVANPGGGATPTSATVSSLSTGTYYLRIAAFSGANPAGSTSTQISVSVP